MINPQTSPTTAFKYLIDYVDDAGMPHNYHLSHCRNDVIHKNSTMLYNKMFITPMGMPLPVDVKMEIILNVVIGK